MAEFTHLQRLEVREDQLLGEGAYGTVFEVEYSGTPYAGKKVHPIFLRTSREEIEGVKKLFLDE